jgi:hypothetical protein
LARVAVAVGAAVEPQLREAPECLRVRGLGWTCDHQIDALIGTARRLEESSRRAAAAAWARVDRATVDEAAWLPLVNPRQLDFVSARVRNFQHHPYWTSSSISSG